MTKRRISKFTFGLGFLVAAFGTASMIPNASAAAVADRTQLLQEFQVANCCHAHPYTPYDQYCCHGTTAVYVAPVYGAGPASVRGTARRTSRRTSRRHGGGRRR